MTVLRPFRLRVLDALCDSLKTISRAGAAGPYAYDMADAVFRGRDLFGEGDPVPMISILENPNPPDPRQAGESGSASAGGWDLLVQGFVQDDPAHPTDPAHFLMADVKAVLAAQRAMDRDYNILGMAGKVTSLTWGSGVARPADEMSAKAYFWLPVTLGLVENQADPFA